MRKLMLGIVAAATLLTAAAPAMARVSFYARPGGVGIGVLDRRTTMAIHMATTTIMADRASSSRRGGTAIGTIIGANKVRYWSYLIS